MTTPATPDERLADFGKRGFLAGAVFFAALSALWRVFDWPTWLGAVASFAGGWAAYRLIEHLAARATEKVQS